MNPKVKRNAKVVQYLSSINLKGFVRDRYLANNAVAHTWHDLCTEIKDKFKILEDVKEKTLINNLRKHTTLRAVNIKRKPFNSNSKGLLQRQLLVGCTILRLLDEGAQIWFFDETVISEKNFKKTAIGTSSMIPLVPNYTITKINLLVLFNIRGDVVVQIASRPNTSYATTNFFRQAIPKIVDTEKKEKIIVVLDNAAVQKTKEFKGLVEVLPLNLLYNIPCSPFLNLVEDFFLEIKKHFKTHFHQNKENCLKSCLQSIKDAIQKKDFTWMLRKLVNELESKIDVHSTGSEDFGKLTPLIKRAECSVVTLSTADNMNDNPLIMFTPQKPKTKIMGVFTPGLRPT